MPMKDGIALSYLVLINGPPKVSSGAFTSIPLLDRDNRAYENTSKLPQSTGYPQAVTLVVGKNSNEAGVFAGRGLRCASFDQELFRPEILVPTPL
jgi:hypothetical protein